MWVGWTCFLLCVSVCLSICLCMCVWLMSNIWWSVIGSFEVIVISRLNKLMTITLFILQFPACPLSVSAVSANILVAATNAEVIVRNESKQQKVCSVSDHRFLRGHCKTLYRNWISCIKASWQTKSDHTMRRPICWDPFTQRWKSNLITDTEFTQISKETDIRRLCSNLIGWVAVSKPIHRKKTTTKVVWDLRL